MARFVSDVVEALDLSAIYAEDEEGDGRGRAAYDLRMMVRVLIYGYCRRVASSRRIERAMYEDVAFRYLAEIQPYIKILPGGPGIEAPGSRAAGTLVPRLRPAHRRGRKSVREQDEDH